MDNNDGGLKRGSEYESPRGCLPHYDRVVHDECPENAA